MTNDYRNTDPSNKVPWRSSPGGWTTNSFPGDDKPLGPGSWHAVRIAAIPYAATFAFRTIFIVTAALYLLNQKHVLPRPLSAFVSKTLFWPTLPITVSRRVGKWMTQIDDTIVMGGAPFGFLNFPERLYKDYGVSEYKFWKEKLMHGAMV